ncbi:hypothetical protein [Polynucleobacter sp. MWH-Aus1W21]|uniref:hypothetical protein n=1 Tax=Polynucleobacter sp. MWH-Aus1W21 TaxID=1855880 RepID=UPI001BFE13A4|nr:hypothetical protein [Polynucleobacter sp. MWH-Aus1W21]QWD65704.1 hypothetical protein ICW03_08590 [Polynucleobacter sp. MWH-Aus1W21]
MTSFSGDPMFFQTVLQNLLRRKKSVDSPPKKELSPMAQSIMQKLAEHDKTRGSGQKEQSEVKKEPKTEL